MDFTSWICHQEITVSVVSWGTLIHCLPSQLSCHCNSFKFLMQPRVDGHPASNCLPLWHKCITFCIKLSLEACRILAHEQQKCLICIIDINPNCTKWSTIMYQCHGQCSLLSRKYELAIDLWSHLCGWLRDYLPEALFQVEADWRACFWHHKHLGISFFDNILAWCRWLSPCAAVWIGISGLCSLLLTTRQGTTGYCIYTIICLNSRVTSCNVPCYLLSS